MSQIDTLDIPLNAHFIGLTRWPLTTSRLVVLKVLLPKRRSKKRDLGNIRSRADKKTPATSAGVAKKSQISSISKANIFDF